MALLTLKFVTDVRDMDYEVVEFRGELDQSTLPNTEKQISELIANFERDYMVFDFTDLSFINSEGIGFLVAVYTKLSKRGNQLVICGARSHVLDVFQSIGFPKLIPVYKNTAEAIGAMKKK